MIRTARTTVLLLCVLALAACSLPRGAALQSEVVSESNAEDPTFDVVPVTRANVPLIAQWPATGWNGAYHWINTTGAPASSIIRAGDHINLTIWDSQENSLLTNPTEKAVRMDGLEVSASGTIFVPYVNEVVVNGLTAEGARERIQRELVPIVPSAQVQLALEPGIGNAVDLVGGVQKPGSYPMPGRNYSILSLLAAGGGVQTALRNPLVRLIRAGKTYEISAERLFSQAEHNTTLRPGDKIIVEEDDRNFTALGASGTEDLIYFPKEYVTALEAVSLMGGLSDARADPKGVLVLREYDAKQLRGDGTGPAMPQVVFTFDLTSADGLFAARKFEINPGDTVLATESPVTRAQTVFALVGSALGLGRQVTTVTN